MKPTLDSLVRTTVAAGVILIAAGAYSCSIGPYKHPVYRDTIKNHDLPSRHYRSNSDMRRVRRGVVETPDNLRKDNYSRSYKNRHYRKSYRH